MHDDWKGAGRSAAPETWWDGQENSWAQQDKENGWHDKISWRQAVLEEELGDDVIKERKHECMDHNRLEAGLATCELEGRQGQQHAWAEHAEQEGWEENLGSSDINHSLCYYLPKKEKHPWRHTP